MEAGPSSIAWSHMARPESNCWRQSSRGVDGIKSLTEGKQVHSLLPGDLGQT